MVESVNASELRANERNQELLKKWREKVKEATDSRLKELAGGKEGTREELEEIVAKEFAREEEFFMEELRKPNVDSLTVQAVYMHLRSIDEPFKP